MTMTEVAPHLGGFVPEGDPATWFPDLWKLCVESLGVTSVLDIGCGAGRTVDFFRSIGVPADGIDGCDTGYITHDFTTGIYTPERDYDLGWCAEVLEHIEERFLPNLIPTFSVCRMLMVTHAFPGQGGHHHVNCREAEYWRGFFAAFGFHEDAELTRLTRAVSRVNLDPWNHFCRSGMVLVR